MLKSRMAILIKHNMVRMKINIRGFIFTQILGMEIMIASVKGHIGSRIVCMRIDEIA